MSRLLSCFTLAAGLACGQNVYITEPSAGSIAVINAKTNTLTGQFTVGSWQPRRIALTPDGSRAYITTVNGAVLVFSTATNSVTATIPAGAMNYDIAITPDGAHAYVTVYTESGSGGEVDVIDTATNTVSAVIHSGDSPFWIAMSPDGSHVYYSSGPSQSQPQNTIGVISTATNTVTATIVLPGQVDGLAVTPDGSKVYASLPTPAIQAIEVISTATNTITGSIRFIEGANIPFGAGGPYAIAFTPDGSIAIVANNANMVTEITVATGKVLTVADVDPDPVAIGITSDGCEAYVVGSFGHGATEIPIQGGAFEKTFYNLSGSAVAVSRGATGTCAAPPTVTMVNPNSGPTSGGTAVTVTGTNFTGATNLTFGGNPAPSFTVVNSTTMTATTPAGSAGPASVVVTTPAGSNAPNQLYTYTVPGTSISAPALGVWAMIGLAGLLVLLGSHRLRRWNS